MFGRKFRLIRNEKNLTLKQLAQQLNISQSYLCDIEHDRGCPSIPTLLGICDRLGVKPGYFFNDLLTAKSRVSETDMISRIAYIENGKEILEQLYDIDKLTEEERKDILEYIKYIKYKSENNIIWCLRSPRLWEDFLWSLYNLWYLAMAWYCFEVFLK